MRQESDSDGRASALDAVLANYMRRVDRGEQIDQGAFIAAHPDLAADLRAYLSQVVAVERVAVGGQAAEQLSGLETEAFGKADTDTGRGRLEVRCPNCHSPNNLAVDTQLTDITCSACGSQFSLVDEKDATQQAPSLAKLGRFELVSRLGMGAFGAVWKARDKELDRTVAIKIPRHGAMTPEDQEKFFREARAAAQLKHPSIVSVHEVGRDGDSIYIVSDFVRGVTLGDWLTGQKLTSREAAELCAKIADALHHAHEQGVVHRDLKPANIMIDGDGQPHLMDFGLARREVGEVTVTMDGHVVGTPAYMSPEQAEGQSHTADGRSDVYSLGVILFQLLTGELPFRGNARMLLHQVINDEPPSPRKLNGNIPKDLETITLKCLEKQPAKRYQSGGEVGDELRRFVAGEPISARPIGRFERGWRWCRRKPVVASLSAALLLVLTAVAVVAPIVAVRQASLRKQAEADERKAKIESAKSQHVANFLKEMLNGVGPAVARGRDTSMLREILDRTEKNLDGLKEQPEVEAEVRSTLGFVYSELGADAKAEAMHRRALAIRRTLFGDEHADIAQSIFMLAGAVHKQNKLSDAETLYREALAMQRKLIGKESYQVAASLNNLASVLADQGELAKAEAMHREAMAIRSKLPDKSHIDLPIAVMKFASVLHQQGKLDEAEANFREALAMAEKIFGDNHPLTATFLINLATTLKDQGKFGEAETEYRRALATQMKLLDETHPTIAATLNGLAQVLAKQGKLADSKAMHQQALSIAKKTRGNESIAVAGVLTDLANVHASLGELAEAESVHREALALHRQLRGGEHVELAGSLTGLATVLRLRGKVTEAESMQREALEMDRKLLGEEHPHVAMSLSNLANTLKQLRKFTEAESLHREALALRRKRWKDGHPDLAMSLYNLANLLAEQGKLDESEELHREALAMQRKLLGDEHLDVAKSLNNLAIVLMDRKKFAEAETMIREALAIKRKLLGDEHLDVANSLGNLALVASEQRKLDEAESLHRESLALFRKRLGNEHPIVARALGNLAGVLYDQEKFADAESMLREALAMQKKLLGDQHPAVVDGLRNLEMLLRKQGRNAEADECRDEADSIAKRRSSKKPKAAEPNSAEK